MQFIPVLFRMMLTLILWNICTPLSNNIRQFNYIQNHVFDDVEFNDNVVSVVNDVRTKISCGKECTKNRMCRSFSHNALRSTCRLHSVIFQPNANYLISTGSRHYFRPLGFCPTEDGYVLFKSLFLCFKGFKDTEMWHSARAICATSGSRLIVLDTQEKHTAVSHYVKENIGVGVKYHIGLTDEADEGIFVWENGDTAGFLPWDSGEPNGKISENCVVLDVRVDLWNDVQCDRLKRYICEKVI